MDGGGQEHGGGAARAIAAPRALRALMAAPLADLGFWLCPPAAAHEARLVTEVEAVRRARAAGTTLPLILLGRGARVADRIAAFDAGADDHLPLPADPAELAARLRALLRRARTAERLLIAADLVVDRLAATATRGGRPLALRPREFALLVHLLRHRGQPQDRAALLAAVCGRHFDPGTNVVEVHVARLRAKLDRGAPLPLLRRTAAGYLID